MTDPGPPLQALELLSEHHEVDLFDCGSKPLNEFLKRFALVNQRGGSARTYVACRAPRVVGYYSLAAASAELDKVPPRVGRGQARHPVPLILLARLGVDRDEQGRGLGSALLRDAILRFLQAEQIIGCRALVTHAKDEKAKAFYQRFGFEPSPLTENHLYLLTKDIRKTLGL